MTKNSFNIRALTVTAVLAALASVLQLINFPIPLMPAFVKLDFADLPGLLASFAFGPLSGVAVCFVKNIVDLIISGLDTAGVGQLANFTLGAVFVCTAGIIYKLRPTKKTAVIAAVIGAVLMALVSVPVNYFIVYPIYTQAYFNGDISGIIGMYSTISETLTGHKMTSLLQCLFIFNLPFTFIKAMISVVITIFIYKPLSPILKGVRR
jgi:riboflavin transporter FmnP